MNLPLKTAASFCLLAAGPAFAQSFTIANPWSGASGDKANLAAFAFEADAGNYPNSISPLGSLDATFEIGSLTLTRPNDTTTPVFGTTGISIADASTAVFIDIYTTYSGGVFSGYIGSSSSSINWNNTTAGGNYTFDFSGIILESTTKYWFAFSTDNLNGNIGNFRMNLNTSGTDGTAGPGHGYLVNDTAQAVSANNSGSLGALQDWGPAFTIQAVPEPSVAVLSSLGVSALLFFRRRA
jgi:hypothetical protein